MNSISSIIAYEIAQGTFYRGPQSFITNIVQVIRSFLQDLRSRKPNFSKKTIVSKKKSV